MDTLVITDALQREMTLVLSMYSNRENQKFRSLIKKTRKKERNEWHCALNNGHSPCWKSL